MSVRSGRGAALAPMADGAAEFLERVLFVQRMVGQRLRVAAVARVLHSEMAGRAAVHAVEFRQKNLPDLNWMLSASARCCGVAARRISSWMYLRW